MCVWRGTSSRELYLLARPRRGSRACRSSLECRPAMNGISERGRRRRRSRGGCRRAVTSTGARYATSIGARAHCCLGRIVPELAAVSSGVGKHQGGVMEVQTRMGARFGMVRQPGQRARVKERSWRTAERVGRMPTPLVERGHRMNFGIMLR